MGFSWGVGGEDGAEAEFGSSVTLRRIRVAGRPPGSGHPPPDPAYPQAAALVATHGSQPGAQPPQRTAFQAADPLPGPGQLTAQRPDLPGEGRDLGLLGGQPL